MRPSRCFGHALLLAVAVALLLSGLFVLALGMTGRFLPHDERFLGMTADQLCALHGCRVVHFMAHDRVSFGGAVVAVGLLYGWLAASPLRQGQAWAWWALLLSGAVGFASFLAYLGYGYLDAWHGLATLGLLPCFLLGLARCPNAVARPAGAHSMLRPSAGWPWVSRACLLGAAAGLVVGGLTILVVGMTCVFVPQDLAYLGVTVRELQSLNARLVPLIAHDRAGFGGAVCCCGVALLFCVWCGRLSRGLWWVLAVAGAVGFGPAIAVHPAVGYNDAGHLAPAVLGALVYLAGLALAFRRAAVAVGTARGLPQEVRP
jgi:hypothetical protein